MLEDGRAETLAEAQRMEDDDSPKKAVCGTCFFRHTGSMCTFGERWFYVKIDRPACRAYVPLGRQ